MELDRRLLVTLQMKMGIGPRICITGLEITPTHSAIGRWPMADSESFSKFEPGVSKIDGGGSNEYLQQND